MNKFTNIINALFLFLNSSNYFKICVMIAVVGCLSLVNSTYKASEGSAKKFSFKFLKLF